MDSKNLPDWLNFEPATVRQVLFVLGTALAGIAALAFIYGLWKPKGRRQREQVALVFLFILGCGLAAVTQFVQRVPEGGFVFVPPGSVSVELKDEANSAALAQLKNARLDGTTATPVGDDWPQWLGPNRNGISTEQHLRKNWNQQPPPVVWKVPGGRGYSSPAIADNRVYVTDLVDESSEERVRCLDAATGKELWSYRYPAEYGRGQYAGPRATPTVHDGKVYAVGYKGQFLCLDARAAPGERRLLWQHDLLKEFRAPMPGWGVASSPLIEADLVIVQPGGPAGSIVAYHRKTGEVVWRARSDVSGYSSPVAATVSGVRQIICFTGTGAAGVRASDGRELWFYPWQTSYNANIATPVVAGDYVFISSNYGTGCALLHVAGNEQSMKAEAVYVKANKLMRNHHMTCVLRDGYLYGCDSGRDLKCVDFRTGQEKWATGKFGKTCLLYADGSLIVQSESGQLVQVEATPAGYREKGRMAGVLRPPECWAVPALAGGRLYLRDHQQVVCLDLRPPKAPAGQ